MNKCQEIGFILRGNFFVTVVTGGKVYILDLAAKLDQCAEYLCKQTWGDIDFPPPFGREAYPEVCLNYGPFYSQSV